MVVEDERLTTDVETEWARALGPRILLEAVSSTCSSKTRAGKRPLPLHGTREHARGGPNQSRAARQVILITLVVAAATWVLYRLERVVLLLLLLLVVVAMFFAYVADLASLGAPTHPGEHQATNTAR